MHVSVWAVFSPNTELLCTCHLPAVGPSSLFRLTQFFRRLGWMTLHPTRVQHSEEAHGVWEQCLIIWWALHTASLRLLSFLYTCFVLLLRKLRMQLRKGSTLHCSFFFHIYIYLNRNMFEYKVEYIQGIQPVDLTHVCTAI